MGGNHHERGVGLILDEENSKTLKEWWALSDQVLLACLNGVPLAIIVTYAPTSDSTEKEVDKFYETLELAKGQCKLQDIIIIIIGNINAKVGSEPFEEIVGKYGLAIQNNRRTLGSMVQGK